MQFNLGGISIVSQWLSPFSVNALQLFLGSFSEKKKKRETRIRLSIIQSIFCLTHRHTSKMKRLYSTAFCLGIRNVLKKSINPVYSGSCACQNPSEIQVEKVDTAQPSRRPEKPDRHLVDNPPPPARSRGLLRVGLLRVTKKKKKKILESRTHRAETIT